MVRMMNKVIISVVAAFILSFFLSLFFVTALNFEYNYTAQTDTIFNNETASYNVTITNNNDFTDNYQLYTINPLWNVDYAINPIKRQSSEDFILEIIPLDNRLTGPQLVPITIKSLQTDELVVENFYVYVKQTNETRKQYVPNVEMIVSMSDAIDPRNPVTLEISLNNRNPLDIKDVTVSITSQLFNKEYQTILGPLDRKTNQILFADLNPMQKPGTYNVNVKATAFGGNVTLGEFVKQVLVEGYSDISIEQTLTRALFSTQEKVVLKNNGNYNVTKLAKLQKNFFERIFTSSSAKPVKLVDSGIAYLSWNVPLEPKQEYTIIVNTNYTPLAIIIIIIIGGIISYYIFRSPVLLFKRAKIVSLSEEGVSDIKVRLHIKNRSGKVIRNIKIVDKYPKIVQLEDESTLGMLKPTKMITADKAHQLLMWNLDVLDPYEERLLVYRLRSTLNIVGNISLPASKIKFHTATGERTYYSNNVKLLHKSHYSLNEE
jgi:nitrogen fixation protein FixH